MAETLPCLKQTLTLQIQYAEHFQRRVGNILLVEPLHTLDLSQVFSDSNGELFYVVFLLIVFIQYLTEESSQILVFWKIARGRFNRINFAMHTQLHPLYPNVLVLYGVQELSIFPVPQEIVNSEYDGGLRKFLSELQVVAYVLT